MVDVNQLFATGQIGAPASSSGNQDGGPPKVQEDTSIDAAIKGLKYNFDTAVKALSAIIPAKFIPLVSNLGSQGLFAGLERGSILDAKINPAAQNMSVRSTTGEFISSLMKNREITNLASDVQDSFASLVGPPGSHGSFSFSDMPSGTPVAPAGSAGAGGSIEIG